MVEYILALVDIEHLCVCVHAQSATSIDLEDGFGLVLFSFIVFYSMDIQYDNDKSSINWFHFSPITMFLLNILH